MTGIAEALLPKQSTTQLIYKCWNFQQGYFHVIVATTLLPGCLYLD